MTLLCKYQRGRLNIKHTSSTTTMHHHYHNQHLNNNDNNNNNDNDHISDATPQCKNQHNTKGMRDREIGSRKNGTQDALRLEPLVHFFFFFLFTILIVIYVQSYEYDLHHSHHLNTMRKCPNDVSHVIWALCECFLFILVFS